MGHSKTNNSTEQFWLERPQDLFLSFTILPTPDDTLDQKLNAVTRLALIITLILFLAGWKHWATFLMVILISLTIVYLNRSIPLIEHFDDFSFYDFQGKVGGSGRGVCQTPIIVAESMISPEVKPQEPVKEEIIEETSPEGTSEYTYWEGPTITIVPQKRFVAGNARK